MDMMLIVGIAIAVILIAVLIGVSLYASSRYYETSFDRTYITADENGFKRALKGKGVLWDSSERLVKGPDAPAVDFVAADPATGGRKSVQLLNSKTGAINLRPQYCAPPLFNAVTNDDHSVTVDARVQFSLNRDLLRHVYEAPEFSMALMTRIHSAYRAEIGKRNDEDLRGAVHEVERAVIAFLRQSEAEGDEPGEQGMALGINFHHASFSYVQRDEFAMQMMSSPANDSVSPAIVSGAAPGHSALGGLGRVGVLSLRPQQLDQLSDVFKKRESAATAALLAVLEMQTRQNIAEALASSGNLIVVTPQELGLTGIAAQREVLARLAAHDDNSAPLSNGNGAPRIQA